MALGTTLLQIAVFGKMKSDAPDPPVEEEAFMESFINSDYFSGPDL